MSKKYEAFVAALTELCKTHGVQISTSGYDAITVNDLPSEGRIGDEPIYLDNIADRTEKPQAISHLGNAARGAWRNEYQ